MALVITKNVEYCFVFNMLRCIGFWLAPCRQSLFQFLISATHGQGASIPVSMSLIHLDSPPYGRGHPCVSDDLDHLSL